MLLRMNGYVVEIKAKKSYLDHSRFNKEDTMCLLNELSIFTSEARDAYQMRDRKGLEDIAGTYSRDIYNFLEGIGYYDELQI